MDSRLNRYYTFVKPVLKNKFVKTYSSVFFSLVTISIFAIYAIRPTISTIVSLQKSVNEQEQILNKLSEKTKSLTDGRKNYQALDDEIKIRLVTLLPDSTALPPIVNDLNTIGIINSATVSGMQFQPVDLEGPVNPTLNKKPNLKEIEFNVNYQGSYPQLTKVLDSFGKTNRLLSILSVNFNKPDEENLIMSISGKAYYFSTKQQEK